MWRVHVLDRFHFSAAARGNVPAIRAAIRSLVDGSDPSDRPFLLPPALWVLARRITNTNLILLFRVGEQSTIRVYAVAEAPDPN